MCVSLAVSEASALIPLLLLLLFPGRERDGSLLLQSLSFISAPSHHPLGRRGRGGHKQQTVAAFYSSHLFSSVSLRSVPRFGACFRRGVGSVAPFCFFLSPQTSSLQNELCSPSVLFPVSRKCLRFNFVLIISAGTLIESQRPRARGHGGL